ncbi:MAG: MBL fold metallo-hydrolase [Ruminococcus sp.]|nr:MBL fold metallo-hydrolase [Ruminococcus sp.]
MESAVSGSVSLSGYTKPVKEIPAEKIDSLTRAAEGTMNLSWLGHLSELVQMGGQNVLIDPILTKAGKPLQMNPLPARISAFALDIDNMPDIDVLCISHDHFDHLDYSTVTAIDGKVGAYVVPLGVDSILEGWGIDGQKIHALAWWESVELGGVSDTRALGSVPLRGLRLLQARR